MSDAIPNPGSPEAIARKCSCAVSDNHYGDGAYTDANGKTHYWINGGCPLHGGTSTPEPMDEKAGDLWT